MARARKPRVVKALFVAARTAAGRPALIHRATQDGDKTKCGRDLSAWSRVYLRTVPDEMDVLRCRAVACQRDEAVGGKGEVPTSVVIFPIRNGRARRPA